GLQGEDANVPAFDIAARWTRSGLGGATIPEGVEPFTSRPGAGDAICALSTVSAGLAALHEQRRTGKGRLVETSLMRTGVYALGWDMSIQLRFGAVRPTRTRGNPANPPADYYRTADGHWLLVLSRGPEDWKGILAGAGLGELIEDARFATPQLRVEHAGELTALLDAAFGALTLDQASRQLTEVDAMWAPLQTPAQVAADPQAMAAGCFVEIKDRHGDTYLSPAAPARFPGAVDVAPLPAPGLGQHTREVLAETGYSGEQIEELIASGAASVIEA
ncbi:MAG: CoA transferase, partial [Frankiaceae bacterium]|nr:CoA transferase [Frankiaceae bacterium]